MVNIDETGWKTAGASRGALTSQSAVFRIAAGRHGFEARTLLGERFAGIVCSDRWRGYDYLDPGPPAALLGASTQGLHRPSEGMGEQQTFGEDGLRIARDLFAAWEGYQQDGDRARLQAQIAPLQDKLHALLEHAARKSTRTKYHRLFAKSLLKRWPALWAFTHQQDGVEPTNNHAERGLRGAVIYRKLSSAANPNAASAPSNGSSPPPSPAAYRSARSSPTSPTSSTPTSEATPSPPSADLTGRLERLHFLLSWWAQTTAGLSIPRISRTRLRRESPQDAARAR